MIPAAGSVPGSGSVDRSPGPAHALAAPVDYRNTRLWIHRPWLRSVELSFAAINIDTTWRNIPYVGILLQ